MKKVVIVILGIIILSESWGILQRLIQVIPIINKSNMLYYIVSILTQLVITLILVFFEVKAIKYKGKDKLKTL